MKATLLSKKLKDKKVRCLVCQRKCLINKGKVGFCLTKLNQGGKLYSLNYGLIPSIQVDPIEKKPFYHFHPGKMAPSIGSYGCNYHCRQCLNWNSSWGNQATAVLEAVKKGKHLPLINPQQIINEIKKAGHQGIAFTYNEPVVWAEFVLDTAKLAKKEGFFTLFVTNGSWSKETLDKIGKYIDAANIDFKGFSEKTYTKMGAFFGQLPEMTHYAQKKWKVLLNVLRRKSD